VSLGAFLGARLGLFLAGVEGGRMAVEVRLGVLWWFLSWLWVGGWSGLRGVSTGSPSGLGLWGVGVVGEVWRWADGVWVGGCVWGWACERRLWGGWALVLVFNLLMGVPLKVACSEDAIALGDAAAVATYLSAGFRLFGFDAGGGRVGGFSGGVGCGVWRGWCGWWF